MLSTLSFNMKEYQSSQFYNGFSKELTERLISDKYKAEYYESIRKWAEKEFDAALENYKNITKEELHAEKPIYYVDEPPYYITIISTILYWSLMCTLWGKIFIYGFNRPSLKYKFKHILFPKTLDFNSWITCLFYGYFYFQLLTFISSIINTSSYASGVIVFFLGIATLIFGYYRKIQENKNE